MNNIGNKTAKVTPVAQTFVGKVFYLDLRSMPQARIKLINQIQLLNGKVGEFFNKNVNYVVTDRPKENWPKCDPNGGKVADDQGTGNEQTAAVGVATPIKAPLITDLLSRGRQIINKASNNQSTQLSQPSTSTQCAEGGHVGLKSSADTLELADRLGIKAISFLDFSIFCGKKIAEARLQSMADLNDETEKMEVYKTVELQCPFIKVEDQKRRYRPWFKQLPEWPEINLDGPQGVSPFVSTTAPRASGLTSHRTAIKSQVASVAAKNLFNDSKAFRPIFNTQTRRNLTVERLGEQTSKNVTTMRINAKRKSPVFCEICRLNCDDVRSHLLTPTHQAYVNNKDNYADLFSVIRSLPSFEEKTSFWNFTPPSSGQRTIIEDCDTTAIDILDESESTELSQS